MSRVATIGRLVPERLRRRGAASVLVLTGAEAGARLLSFLFYIAAARVLEPSSFGTVRYTIVLAGLAYFGGGIAAIVLTKELGRVRDVPSERPTVLGTGVAVGLLLAGATTALCAGAALAGLVTDVTAPALAVVLAGRFCFEMYYAICKGLGDVRRAAVVYVGGSVIQIAVFLVLAVVEHPGATTTLLVFGCSSLAPVVAYEIVRPQVLRSGLRVTRAAMRRYLRLGRAVGIGAVGYIVWSSVDQIWVQERLGAHASGEFAAAKNLVQVLVVVPQGIMGFLLPRVAQMLTAGDPEGARRLVRRWVGLGALVSAAIVAVLLLAAGPIITVAFGHRFDGATTILRLLAAGWFPFAVFWIAGGVAVAWDRGSVWSAAITAAAVVQIVLLLLLARDDVDGAAWATAASGVAALAVTGALLVRRPLGR